MTGVLQRKRLRQAVDLTNQGRLDDAEKILDAVVLATPDFAEAWLQLATVRLARSEARLAYEAFTRAAGFASTAAEARTALGRLARPGAGDHLRDRNFRQALLIDPTYLPALTDLAALRGGVVTRWFALSAGSGQGDQDPFRELINRRNIGPAIRLAQIAAVMRPASASARRNLARLVFQLEDLEGRAKYLKQATLFPSPPLGDQIEAVDALFQAQDLVGAERYARRALETDPTSALALFWLGRTVRCLGRFDEARAALAEAERHDENFALRIRVVEQGINPADFHD
jgi:tetratricopeptide (TPR) repeat protein